MNRVEINVPLRRTLCCGNTVKFVIFIKSHCLNFMTDSKNKIMVVERLCALGFQITNATKSEKTQSKTRNKLLLNVKSFLSLIVHNMKIYVSVFVKPCTIVLVVVLKIDYT
jgi:hypothetical protein